MVCYSVGKFKKIDNVVILKEFETGTSLIQVSDLFLC
jgi:hypothetical protein